MPATRQLKYETLAPGSKSDNRPGPRVAAKSAGATVVGGATLAAAGGLTLVFGVVVLYEILRIAPARTA